MKNQTTEQKKTTKSQLAAAVEDAFTMHPTVNILFTTNDGYVFMQAGDAKLHASSQENKSVEEWKRGGAETNSPVKETEDQPAGAAADTAPKV